jgi:hypothetical protein
VFRANHDAQSGNQKNNRLEKQEYDFFFVSLIDAYWHVPHDEEARCQNKIIGLCLKVKVVPKTKIN